VWRKLRKQIAVERELLNLLLEDHRPLLDKCAISAPDRIEVSALAAMLHAFYCGIENIFRRIVVELNEGLAKGEGWHKELLDRMIRPGADRPPVISGSLAEALRWYLEFRHVFREAYTFQLKWERMSGLVLECEATLRRLEGELDAFLKATETKE